MKRNLTFLIIFFLLNACIGSQRKSIGNDQERINKLHEGINNPNLQLSPKGDFAYLVSNENKKDISTVIIFNLEDSSLVFQKNIYLESIKWRTDHIVRIHLRPEMIMSDNREKHFFDFNVMGEKYQKK